MDPISSEGTAWRMRHADLDTRKASYGADLAIGGSGNGFIMIDIPPSVLPEHTASVRRAVSGLSPEIKAAWHTRYLTDDGGEMRATAMVERVESVLRTEGRESTIRAVWIELADRAGVTGDGDTGAAAALAGLAAGLTMA